MIIKVRASHNHGWLFIDHVYEVKANPVRFTEDRDPPPPGEGRVRVSLDTLEEHGIPYTYYEVMLDRAERVLTVHDTPQMDDGGRPFPEADTIDGWLLNFQRFPKTGTEEDELPDRPSMGVTLLTNMPLFLLNDQGDTIESLKTTN